MKPYIAFLSIALIGPMLLACAKNQSYHNASLPEPSTYNVHFGDMDSDGNERVDRKEFKAHFPEAKAKVFNALDINKDQAVDHDEWHQFKEAHGLKH